MKRTSSWKNLQKTFASTPVTVPKKTKFIRKKTVKNENLKKSFDECIDIQIEDSDEENVPSGTPNRTPLQTPVQRHMYRRLAKPLLINSCINTSIANNSIVDGSESDESFPAEPELRDVSEYIDGTRRHTARTKSLSFLLENKQNQITSHAILQDQHTDRDCDTSTDALPGKRLKYNIKTVSNNNTNNRSRMEDPNTNIESDSSNGTESPKKNKPPSNKRKTCDIVFTQSSESQGPVIESESSQFSLKFESPNIPLQRKRLKTRKHVKGGLVERLNKVLSSTKSEFSFWMNERTSDLIEPGEKMRIDKMERNYGRILLHCSNVSPNNTSNRSYVLCIDPEFKKLPMLYIGKVIEVGLDSDGYAISSDSLCYPKVSKILV